MKELDQKTVRRVKIIKGQIDGVLRMITDDEYCIDILTQILAVQESLKSLSGRILENHMKCCVAKQFTSGEKEKAIEELLKIYKLSNKK